MFNKLGRLYINVHVHVEHCKNQMMITGIIVSLDPRILNLYDLLWSSRTCSQMGNKDFNWIVRVWRYLNKFQRDLSSKVGKEHKKPGIVLKKKSEFVLKSVIWSKRCIKNWLNDYVNGTKLCLLPIFETRKMVKEPKERSSQELFDRWWLGPTINFENFLNIKPMNILIGILSSVLKNTFPSQIFLFDVGTWTHIEPYRIYDRLSLYSNDGFNFNH